MGNRFSNRGFTIVELIIVMVILGLLAFISIAKYHDFSHVSKIAATKNQLGAVRSAFLAKYTANANASTEDPFPKSLIASDFATGSLPVNALASTSQSVKQGVLFSQQKFTGKAQSTSGEGFWIYDPVDKSNPERGRAGAFSDGIEDTSTW